MVKHSLNGSLQITFFGAVSFRAHLTLKGGGPGVVVSTAAFHARVRGSVPGLGC